MLTFGQGFVVLTGKLYPSFEVWQYGSFGARPLIYYDGLQTGPAALFAGGILGVARTSGGNK